MFPDWTFPLVFEMREPVGRFDDDRARARFRPRQACPVRRGDITNVLAKPRRRGHLPDRDICLTSGSAILAEPGQSADGDRVTAGAFSLPQEDMPCSNVCCSLPTVSRRI